MILPSIPPPRPAGVEEGGKGGREGKRFIVAHSFITVDLFVISSFGFQDQHRIYISKSVTFYVFLCGVLCERKISDRSFFYFVPPTLSVPFFAFFRNSLAAMALADGRHTNSATLMKTMQGLIYVFFSHFISDKVCCETKVRREKKRCSRKRISLFDSLVFVVF